MLWDPKQDMVLPSKKSIEGGKYTHQGPHKAVLDTFIPMGTLERFRLSPNIMEVLRNERYEQHDCRRSRTKERKVLKVQIGFQKLLSHCFEIERSKCGSRATGM